MRYEINLVFMGRTRSNCFNNTEVFSSKPDAAFYWPGGQEFVRS